jgi:peptidoglycan hydrolase-like protein with peptidoglycan-binding domain
MPGKRRILYTDFIKEMRYIAAIMLVLGVLVADRATAYAATGETERNVTRLQEAETLLSQLGYWVTRVDGVADSSTKHAVTAFQKVEGLKRTGVLNDATLERLRTATRPVPKHIGSAHVEIDISRQVLFMVDDSGTITHVLPVSTGNGERYFSEGKWQTAYTPRGNFKVTRQIKGNRKAALGTIYYPSYFNGGIAIHGSNSIPPVAASHGCARIPRFAEKQMSDLVKVGMPVYVYD